MALHKMEDSMMPYASNMIMANFMEDRLVADSLFTRSLVRALRTPYSYSYPFDSIATVSKIYAPDSTFRIFTWQFERDESYFRQRGAIQMKTADGSLKLFPLIDASPFTANPTDSVRSNLNWIGAIYYGIVQKQYNGKNYYTLFGYDDNDIGTTRKWIDVLTFNKDGKPQFGGPFFNYPEDSIKPPQPAYRFCLEYKKDAHPKLNYDPEMDMIVFDHLVSETDHQSQKYTLIPDGDYEGFVWKNGKWNYINKIFTSKLEDGQAPVPRPLKDDE
ncbi:MAG: hypothetical protein M3R72_09550 [Bacteroidota bacterium]|nr:hypothetical protein [Bacteroidota bacterium]